MGRDLGEWIDAGGKALGEGLQWVGDKAADQLENVGWQDGAKAVRTGSDIIANRLGAEVDEYELGQTDDPKRLVHGSASKLRATASHLSDFQAAFDQTGQGLKGLDHDGIQGASAEAFRTTAQKQPPKWFAAADAFETAAGALNRFADTVEWAQGRAQEALDEYKTAVKTSQAAHDAYNKWVDSYNEAVRAKQDPLPARPMGFTDPGTDGIKAAREKLAEARRQRDEAAQSVVKALETARDAAPPMPSATMQLASEALRMGVSAEHAGGGFVKGAAETISFFRAVDPDDPYNRMHPTEYKMRLQGMGVGLMTTANDPAAAGSRMYHEFMKDPDEFGAKAFFDVVAGTKGIGTGASALKRGSSLGRLAEDIPTGPGRKALKSDSPDAQTIPDGDRQAGGDPVDLATGRMFLPQTDIELPGILPLVFTRRTESGLTVGRFLGPAWTSTVDERLEIDAIGIVHVTAEGLLISYPHPAPGVPTHPESGSARTLLARDAGGDYTVTDPDSGLTFHFSAPADYEPGGYGEAWLCAISERNGHTISVDRDEEGVPLALVHSAGHYLKLSVVDGLVTGLSLSGAPNGGADLPLMSYGYEADNLTTVTKPSGAITSFVYDERRRVTAWIDSNGSRYDYTYDERDRVVAEGGEAGHIQIALTYSEPHPETGLHTTTLTTEDGHATHHLFDHRCRLLAVTDPLGNTTRFTHDARGNLLRRTDALGLTTSFCYDDEGRVIRAVRPDGSELRTVRGRFGLPVEVFGADGSLMLHEYDEHGNRTAVTDAAGFTTRYTYDDAGRLTSLTDAAGATTSVVCNAAGLPVEVVDPAGAITRTERDALGRPVRITDPTGAVTRLVWHADGQLARRTGPDGAMESWTYDGEGNLLTCTDASGGVTRFEYTHFDLPVSRTGPDGARHEFEHDTNLRLTRVTNPEGLNWSYEYDAADNIVSETNFDGCTLTYRLDAAGRLAARVDALGGTISFERDMLGQAIAKDVDGRVTTYAYDAAGRLLAAIGPDGELRYQYDRRGKVMAELVDGRPLTYAYDPLGRRTRRTTPTGHVTTYDYGADGAANRLTTGHHRVDFTHDAAGRELARIFDGMVTVASAWDEAGRLSEQQITAGGSAVNSRAYTYRADGHLTSVADRLSGTRAFDLDPAGRVTAVHAHGWTERYAYDTAGNQTSASWPSGHPGGEAIGPRTYTGTALTRAGGVRFEHDALGRIVLRQKARLSRKPDTWHYGWDTENRLTSVTTPDGTRWRYRYDPLGRRTAKQRMAADGETVVEEVRFTWDGLTLCEQTSHQPDLPHTVALTWDHRSDVPLAQTERILTPGPGQEEIDRRFFAIATDLVGTPTELIDESGDIAWRARATLWGTTAWARDSSTYTPLRFPGQYYDPETGLHYNYFRHYDPETGRYTSPDPLGLAPAPNPLSYVDNPHGGCDPLGLMPKYTKEQKAQQARERAIETADAVVKRAQSDRMNKAANYHADSTHGFSNERVLEILKSPDAVYHSTAGSGRLIFRQGEDIVVAEGGGAGAGNAITAYGPSGVRGESGATALGGSPADPGGPVTHTDVVNGRIPAKNGYLAPAVRIR
ncbi:putative T7SS-secreted protein [Streptomyces sp. NPDC059533]